MMETGALNERLLWLGKIPQEWESIRIGSLYDARNEKVSDTDYAALSVTMKGIVPQLDSVAKSNDSDNRKLVCKGDFVINSRSDRRGSCGISDYDGSVSLINTVLMPKNEMNPGYYDWLFHTVAFADEFYKWGHGIVNDLWTTRWQEMKLIIVPVPPLEEQALIAGYLDRECAKIDDLINEAKTSVDEYKKWKIALISELVTKGLASVKDYTKSTIEWLPIIPSHWETGRLVHCNWIRGRLGWKGLKADEYVNEGYPFLSAFNIINNKLSWSQLNFITQERYDESPEIKLSVGDILLVKDGAGIGKCARVDDLPLGETTVNSSLAVITPNADLDYRYECYYFQSNIFQNIIARLRNGMGVPHLTQEAMKEISLPLPPLNEQQDIANYLDEMCYEIDGIIEEKQSLISDMEAYKQALVYEMVTGKRRVV